MDLQKTQPRALSGLGEIINSFIAQKDTGALSEEVAALPFSDDPNWSEFDLELMRQSPAYFAAQVLEGPRQAPYNGRFMVADHHIEWDALVQENDRLCVLAPRDSGKSFFFNFAVPLHKIVFGPKKKGYIFSATEPQAVEILEIIKLEIENNPLLAWLLPSNRAKSRNWSKKKITLSNGHQLFARGYGTKIRGGHPHYIIVDDGLNDEDATSELIRKANIQYFLTAITGMILPGGQIIVIGTPFHAADLYGHLEKTPTYCFRRYKSLQPDGTALWPERYCATKKDRLALAVMGILVKSLEEILQEIGSLNFTREYMCEPISDEMSLFPRKLFHACEVPGAIMGAPAEYYTSRGIKEFYIGFDFAMSSSTSADYTVGFVLGIDENENRWVVDIQRHKGLPFLAQKSLINALGRKYNAAMIFLEANSMQMIFGDELIRETSLPIFKFVTSGQSRKKSPKHPKGNQVVANKNSLAGGVPSLRVLLENAKVRIPVGDTKSAEKADKWIDEMQAFTFVDGKLQGVGEHDDTVMAFWIADCAVKQGGGGFDNEDPGPHVEEDLTIRAEVFVDDPVTKLLAEWGKMEDIPELGEEYDDDSESPAFGIFPGETSSNDAPKPRPALSFVIPD